MKTLTLPGAPDAPERAPGDPTSFVTVFANLLPDEIVAARRVQQLRRRVLAGLLALLVLIAGGYGYSTWQTRQAQHDLTAAQDRTLALQHQQQQFTPLVQAQSRSAAIEQALHTAMTGDLNWTRLLAALRAAATRGVTVTSISGTVTTATGGTAQSGTSGGLGVLNETGKQQAGTIALTGTAPNKDGVAGYVDALAKVPGLAVPFPASVTDGNNNVTFSVNLIITTAALGGRYTNGGN